MKLSCLFVCAAFAQDDLYSDDLLKSDFYGPIEDTSYVAGPVPNVDTCCQTLKLWGDIGLFAGRFDQTTKIHNGFPVYRAAGGDMKIFFNKSLNRWSVSDEVNDRVLLRALGGDDSCPDSSDWLVWDGVAFSAPDLTEPWAPYVESDKMLECRPTDFSVEKLKSQIGDSLCHFLRAESGQNSGRFCREGEKIAEMIFADWDLSTNNFLNENLQMVLSKVKSLDQWHSVVNSILIKRTFETRHETVDNIRSYIRLIVSDIKSNYKESTFAEDDNRFLYLKV